MFTHPELIFLQLTERRLELAGHPRRQPDRARSWLARRARPAGRDLARTGPAASLPAGTLAACTASGGEAR